ncbi:MAG: redoxin domain-containing protein [Planctomycetales bacterium]|nr:redoxin domain-containing protein [Planctomycetales bacterium]
MRRPPLPLFCPTASTTAPRRPVALPQTPAWRWLCWALSLPLLGCGHDLPAQPPRAGPAAEVDVPSGEQAGGADPAGDLEAGPHPFPRRVPAPSLDGDEEWLNTNGPLSLPDLRGKFVLLDFWTYCCINCMHVLPELKKLERAYPQEVVVIGIHSAKFETEKDSENIRQAIQRYEIEHPVVNDAEMVIWRRYGIRGWPALRVIDPEGQLIAAHGGEIDFASLDRFFRMAIPFYQRRGLLDKKPLRWQEEGGPLPSTPLRYPGKLLADPDSGRLYIADSGHHRIVVTDLAGRLLETIGTGQVGQDDGPYAQATFNHPQGMALHGQTLYVCDTQNHLIRKLDLTARRVETVAGTGQQNRGMWPGMDQRDLRRDVPPAQLARQWVSSPRKMPLASPWALQVHDGYLYIAMAGPHQIWRMSLDEKSIAVYAGNGREDIVDGQLLPPVPPRLDRAGFDPRYSSFAQPSGLASDGQWLYVADTEGSSIRAVPFDPQQSVRTIVGTSQLPAARLFIFGDRDGQGLLEPLGTEGNLRFQPDAAATRGPLLQHAIGVAYRDGQLYVADTYNNKIKQIDLRQQSCRTIAGTGVPGREDQPASFDEPAGLTIAGEQLFVADTNNHLIRVVDLSDGYAVKTLPLEGLAPPARTPPASDAVGEVEREGVE